MLLTPPAPLCLRPMELEDIDPVMAIEAHSFPTPWPAGGYRHELTNNRRAHYYVLLCRDQGKPEQIVGYTGYWLMAGEAHISTVAVKPDCRGLGLGELLLLQVLSSADEREAELVTLEVRRSNEVAQSLYRKFGFENVGRRKGYYRDTGEDALLMTVYLAPAYRNLMAGWRDTLWRRLQEEVGGGFACC